MASPSAVAPGAAGSFPGLAETTAAVALGAAIFVAACTVEITRDERTAVCAAPADKAAMTAPDRASPRRASRSASSRRAVGRLEYDPARGAFRNWLFTLVRRKLSNWRRSKRNRPDSNNGAATPRLLDQCPAPQEGKAAWETEWEQQLFALFNETVLLPPWAWKKTFDLSGIELGEKLVLDIVSDTFIPNGLIEGNDDARTLGVQVWSIKLLRDEEKPAAAEPQ